MNPIFLSMDIEECSDLEYLVKYDTSNQTSAFDGVHRYVELLKKYDLKSTFFVLDKMATQHRNYIKALHEDGHEIACHGLNHTLLFNLSDREFEAQLKKAKYRLEDIIGASVNGYRAPCFSISNSKLDVIRKLGFTYDSSKINFAIHPFYGKLDTSGWSQSYKWITQCDGFYEFELPTHRLPIINKTIPISGGGYARLFPDWLYLTLVKNSVESYGSFIFYIHPFECSKEAFTILNISKKDHFRLNVGREKVIKTIEKMIEFFTSKKLSFLTFSQYISIQSEHR